MEKTIAPPKFSEGKFLAQGAEAILILKGPDNSKARQRAKRASANLEPKERSDIGEQMPHTPQEIIIKRRVKKGYRLEVLDEKLRKLRTRSESKLLEKASKLISVPKLIEVNEKTQEIEMEFINGKKLSEHLDKLENWKEVCEQIGENIAKLHDAGIIHGDLTTSNMILAKDNSAQAEVERSLTNKQKQLQQTQTVLCANNLAPAGTLSSGGRAGHTKRRLQSASNSLQNKVYFIDFGLGFHSNNIEDKAVDLHLIKEALEAKHFENYEEFFKAVLTGYKKSSHYEETLKRLEKVEKRGRYKNQY
jgi:Kae1-associated kinase Bud32